MNSKRNDRKNGKTRQIKKLVQYKLYVRRWKKTEKERDMIRKEKENDSLVNKG